MKAAEELLESKGWEKNNPTFGGSLFHDIASIITEFTNLKMIEENESILEMAKRHMDQRAIVVLEKRIEQLKSAE